MSFETFFFFSSVRMWVRVCVFPDLFGPSLLYLCTVKLLLNEQLRDHQKVVAEEKWPLNATKVHLTKQSGSMYHTLTTLYFEQNPVLLVLI